MAWSRVSKENDVDIYLWGQLKSRSAELAGCQALTDLSCLPAEAPLLWSWPAGKPLQDLILELYTLRVQQAYRGPICLGVRGKLESLLQDLPWLQQQPGLKLCSQQDPASLQHFCQQPPAALNSVDWESSARSLCWQQLASLRHDLQQALQRTPSEPQIKALLQRLEQGLGHLKPQLGKLWTALQNAPAEALAVRLQSLWLALASSAPELLQDSEALNWGLYSLKAHWEAALKQLQQLNQTLASQSPLPQDQLLWEALQSWQEQHPASRLGQSQPLLKAAAALKALMQAQALKSEPSRHSPLSQSLHNGLEQHLYTAANLIQYWLPHWERQQREPQPLVLSALPQSTPTLAVRQAVLESSLAAPSSQDRILLILDDDPTWRQILSSHVNQALAHFLQDHPQQQFRRWQVRTAADLTQATALLDQTCLLLADLSVPQVSGGPARREHGVNFLRAQIGAYRRHFLPVIVNTFPSWFLADQLELSQAAGIGALDFLFKTHYATEIEARIRYWLDYLRAREQHESRSHVLTCLPSKGHGAPEFQLDQVRLRLSPRQASLLQQLTQSPSLSAEAILAREPEPEASQASAAQHPFAQRLAKALGGLNPLHAAAPSQSLRFIQHQWQLYTRHHKATTQNWQRFLQTEILPLKHLAFWFEQDDRSPLAQILQQTLPELNGATLAQRYLDFFDPSGQTETERADPLQKAASERIYRLKRALTACFHAVGQELDANEILGACHDTGSTHYRLQPQVEVRQGQRVPRSPSRQPLAVLIVEDDPVYAAQIQACLERFAALERQPLELQTVSCVAELPAALAQQLPELVLLDLHLPVSHTDPASASETGGFEVLAQIRCQAQPKVLVTSVLTHDDDLRRLGLKLGVSVRDFVPKGELHQGAIWPDSLYLHVKRAIQEHRLQALQPTPLLSELWPQTLPLHVHVSYFGPPRPGSKARQMELALRIEAHLPTGLICQQAEHLDDRARWLALLLRRAPDPISQSESAAWLFDQPDKDLNNLRNRLRREELSAKWPLAWIEEPNPGCYVLRQSRQSEQAAHWLAIERVSDPQGWLAAILKD